MFCSVPIPKRYYRHFKGNVYEVLEVTLPGCPPSRGRPSGDLISWYEAVDTETGRIYEVVSPQSSSRSWLRNSEGKFLDGLYVLYTSRDEGKSGLVWARPIKSWMSPAAPSGFWRRWLFRLGLISGIERFTPMEARKATPKPPEPGE